MNAVERVTAVFRDFVDGVRGVAGCALIHAQTGIVVASDRPCGSEDAALGPRFAEIFRGESIRALKVALGRSERPVSATAVAREIELFSHSRLHFAMTVAACRGVIVVVAESESSAATVWARLRAVVSEIDESVLDELLSATPSA